MVEVEQGLVKAEQVEEVEEGPVQAGRLPNWGRRGLSNFHVPVNIYISNIPYTPNCVIFLENEVKCFIPSQVTSLNFLRTSLNTSAETNEHHVIHIYHFKPQLGHRTWTCKKPTVFSESS